MEFEKLIKFLKMEKINEKIQDIIVKEMNKKVKVSINKIWKEYKEKGVNVLTGLYGDVKINNQVLTPKKLTCVDIVSIDDVFDVEYDWIVSRLMSKFHTDISFNLSDKIDYEKIIIGSWAGVEITVDFNSNIYEDKVRLITNIYVDAIKI